LALQGNDPYRGGRQLATLSMHLPARVWTQAAKGHGRERPPEAGRRRTARRKGAGTRRRLTSGMRKGGTQLFERVSIGLLLVCGMALLVIERSIPNPFELYDALGNAQRQGKITEALLLAEKLSRRHIHSDLVSDADRRRLDAELGELYFQSGDLTKAHALFDRAHARLATPVPVGTDGLGLDVTDRAALTLSLIDIRLQQNQLKQAALLLSDLTQTLGNARLTYFDRKHIFARMTPLVVDLSDRLARTDPRQVDDVSSLLRIQAFLDDRRQVQASAALQTYLISRLSGDERHSMDYVESLLDLARYDFSRGSPETAARYAEDAIALLTEMYSHQSIMLLPALALQARIRNDTGQHEKTIERLEPALEIVATYGDPDMPGAVDVIQALKVAYQLADQKRDYEKLEREYGWMVDMVPIDQAEAGFRQSAQLEQNNWRRAGLAQIFFWSGRSFAGPRNAHRVLTSDSGPARDPAFAHGRADLFVYEQLSPPPADKAEPPDQSAQLSALHTDHNLTFQIQEVVSEPKAIVFQRMKTQTGNGDPILVVVHDAGRSFKDTMRLGAYLKIRTGIKGPVIVFDWPASAHGFGHLADRASTASVAARFADLQNELAERFPETPVYLLAVGVGARIVYEASRSAASNAPIAAPAPSDARAPHRLILWGPDLTVRELGELKSRASREHTLTLYQLSRSRTLSRSKRLTDAFPVGAASSGALEMDGVDTIRSYPSGLIEVRSRAGSSDALFLFDLKRLLTMSPEARERCGLRPIYTTRLRYWIARHKNCTRINLSAPNGAGGANAAGGRLAGNTRP